MNRHRAMRAALGVWILVASAVFAARPAVQRLVDRMPADDTRAAREIYVALQKLGGEGINEVCALVVPPGTGNDIKARYLVSGLAFHVNRPGAEAERAVCEQAILHALATAGDVEVKAFFISQLRWCGKAAAVSALAPYLASAPLCEPATFALLNAGQPEAAAVLQAALADADETRAPTLIRALGELRSAASAPLLRTWAESGNRDTRHLAQFALANIGDRDARSLLRDRLAAGTLYDRSETAAHFLLLAQRLAAAGDAAPSVAMCRELVALPSGVLKPHVRCAALADLAQRAGKDAVDDLLGCLADGSGEVRASALASLGRIPGADVTRRLADRLPKVVPETRLVLIAILGARRDAAALPSLSAALKDADSAVRLAVVKACAQIGGAAAATVLLGGLEGADAAHIGATARVLGKLPDKHVGGLVARAAGKGAPDVRAALLGVLASRRATRHVDVPLAALNDASGVVRQAALGALSSIGGERDLPVLVAYLLKTDDKKERATATRAIVSLARPLGTDAARTGALVAAWRTVNTAQRATLLGPLGQLGGADALGLAVEALGAGDAALRDVAVRTLADWVDAGAVDTLLKLAETSDDLKHRVLALRGVVRLARASDMDAARRLAVLRKAIGVAGRPDEKRLAISALTELRTVAALDAAVGYLGDAPVQREAAVTVANLAVGTASPDDRLRLAGALHKAQALLPAGAQKKALGAVLRHLPDPANPNLALRRPVKTSCGHQGNHLPVHAVDGDTAISSGWWGEKFPCWLQVDLGKISVIGSFRAVYYWSDARYYQYTIEGSRDGQKWQKLVDNSKTTQPCMADGVTHVVAPAQARFVRINTLKNSANEAVHLIELEVYAPGKGR